MKKDEFMIIEHLIIQKTVDEKSRWIVIKTGTGTELKKNFIQNSRVNHNAKEVAESLFDLIKPGGGFKGITKFTFETKLTRSLKNEKGIISYNEINPETNFFSFDQMMDELDALFEKVQKK